MAIFDKPENTQNLGPFLIFSGHPSSDVSCYRKIKRNEVQESQSSDDFKYCFKTSIT